LSFSFKIITGIFFKEHPQLIKNDFCITGESYAGHYIPALASRVHNGNKNKEGIIINFKVLQYPNVAFDSDSLPNERS
jgi:carboxypeptidase C (cathepsin A)